MDEARLIATIVGVVLAVPGAVLSVLRLCDRFWKPQRKDRPQNRYSLYRKIQRLPIPFAFLTPLAAALLVLAVASAEINVSPLAGSPTVAAPRATPLARFSPPPRAAPLPTPTPTPTASPTPTPSPSPTATPTPTPTPLDKIGNAITFMTRQAASIRNYAEHDKAIRDVVNFAVSEQRYVEAEDAARRPRLDANRAAALRFVALCMGLDGHPERADAAASKIKNETVRDAVKSTLVTIRLAYLERGANVKLALEGEPPCRMKTAKGR